MPCRRLDRARRRPAIRQTVAPGCRRRSRWRRRRPRSPAARRAGGRTGTARRAEAEAPSRHPPRSPTVSLARASPEPYLHRVDLNLLKQAAIFQDLDEGELARVAEVCREQKFAVGQHVFKEGEPGNRLFIISEGEVRISRTIPGSGEEALAVLKPGSCFGEMSIFDRSERSTDAIANISCTLITISRSEFELLLDFNRDIAYKVLWSVVRLLSARLRVTNDNLRSFLAMSMF